MTHSASARFWERYGALPKEVQALADKTYELVKHDPRHPSQHFKKLGKFWSVRVGSHHRALAVEIEGGFLWVWIGTHGEYDRLVSGQR